jgi:hypothetical protein
MLHKSLNSVKVEWQTSTTNEPRRGGEEVAGGSVGERERSTQQMGESHSVLEERGR